MAQTRQERKHTTGLAGEYLVAGELLRRGIMAAVTYGNAKKADVVAFDAGRSVLLEVKSTSESKWVLGGGLPAAEGLWVLVFLPPDRSQPPEYFLLSNAELLALVMPKHEAYMARYRSKHGREFDGRGVCSLERVLVAGSEHCGAWHKVEAALGLE